MPQDARCAERGNSELCFRTWRRYCDSTPNGLLGSESSSRTELQDLRPHDRSATGTPTRVQKHSSTVYLQHGLLRNCAIIRRLRWKEVSALQVLKEGLRPGGPLRLFPRRHLMGHDRPWLAGQGGGSEWVER